LTTAAAQWSVSRDGSVVFWRGPAQPRLGDLHLAWVDRKGAVETLKIPANAYSSPRVSPDGKRLAVQIDDENGSSIWTYDLSGARAIQRLSFEGNGRYPIWAGDSEHVIFQSDRDGSGALYRQRADGAEGAVRLTTPTAGETHVPDSWALHANRFSYEVVADGQSTLWTYSMVDRKGVPFGTLKTTGFINSAFSPDGRAIAYNTIDDPTRGLTNIYIEPFPPTGSKSMVGRGFNNPFWSVDGKELIYSVGNSNLPFEGVVAQSTPPYLLANPVVVPRAQFTGLNTTVGPRQYDVARDGRIIGLRSTVGELSRRVNVVLNWSQELQRLVPSR
jgi:WD40 repeat protein